MLVEAALVEVKAKPACFLNPVGVKLPALLVWDDFSCL
jgi:hypothetical protein